MNEHQQPSLHRHEPAMPPTGESGEREITAPPVDEAPSMRPTGQSGVQKLSVETVPRENSSPVHTLLVRVRDTCTKPVQRVMHLRGRTAVIRLSDDAKGKVDTLIAAGVFETRGETTAFLIDEGIQAQESLFRDVEQKMRKIESLQSELRSAHHGHG